MKTHISALLAAALLLSAGCSHTPTSSAATDEERAEQLGAQLEELRLRVQSEPPGCPGWKELARKVCGLSTQACEHSTRHPERLDLQKRCTQSQEDCARFSDQAARCP